MWKQNHWNAYLASCAAEKGMTIKQLCQTMGVAHSYVSRASNRHITMSVRMLKRFRAIIGPQFDLLYWSVYFGHMPVEWLVFCMEHPSRAIQEMKKLIESAPHAYESVTEDTSKGIVMDEEQYSMDETVNELPNYEITDL